MKTNNPKTPGVYIVERNAFPNSIAQVPTAIPAFIGYTEKAILKGKPLTEPLLINSMAEYREHFGGGPLDRYPIMEVIPNPTPSTGKKVIPPYDLEINDKYYKVGQPSDGNRFYLYYCIQFFYQNGGGPCYITSIGSYTSKEKQPSGDIISKPTIPHKDDFLAGLEKLPKILSPKPTILLAPDSLLLNSAEYYTIQQQILMQCGELKDRVALIDVYEGYKDIAQGVIKNHRNSIGNNYLNYGISYYPFLETTIVDASDMSFENVDQTLPGAKKLSEIFIGVSELSELTKNNNPDYKKLMAALVKQAGTLPPSAAMAGVFTLVDSTEGVWVSPANRNINSVITPTVEINNDQQASLNVDALAGKSINAIRSFFGRGPAIIWGARTLDGNSQDWRYVSVRRTLIMIEQSIALAAQQFVFEANDASTWMNCENMLNNFLRNLWSAGALQGATPTDAYQVVVGLGKTMTAQDILNGIMRIQASIALVRPAEFIIITYEQEMVKS